MRRYRTIRPTHRVQGRLPYTPYQALSTKGCVLQPLPRLDHVVAESLAPAISPTIGRSCSYEPFRWPAAAGPIVQALPAVRRCHCDACLRWCHRRHRGRHSHRPRECTPAGGHPPAQSRSRNISKLHTAAQQSHAWHSCISLVPIEQPPQTRTDSGKN